MTEEAFGRGAGDGPEALRRLSFMNSDFFPGKNLEPWTFAPI